MYFNKWLLATACVLAIVATIAVTALHAGAPSALRHVVEAASVNPAYVVINTATPIVISTTISDPTVIANSVNLLQTDPSGKTLNTVGVMHDDGMNGDATAADKVFSYRVTASQSAVGEVYYRASAAFKGTVQRVLSPIVALGVWQRYSDPSNHLVLAYPTIPGVTASITSDSQGATTYAIETSPGHFAPAFYIFIEQNSTAGSLNDWFVNNVDSSGELLNGTFASMDEPTGVSVLTLSGVIPSDWDGGPLPYAYIMSASKTMVATVQLSQDDPLEAAGLTTEAIAKLLDSIVQTINLQ